MSTTAFAHRIDAAIERFDIKELNATTFLVLFLGALSRALPVFLMPLVVLFESWVWLCCKYQWFINGLTLTQDVCFLVLDLRSSSLLACEHTFTWFWLEQRCWQCFTAMFKMLVLQFLLCLEQMRLSPKLQKNKWLPSQKQLQICSSMIRICHHPVLFHLQCNTLKTTSVQL